jgi:hypothetical protein
MMGERTVLQEPLFFGFSLERHAPADHLLRAIDRFVDLDGVRSTSRRSAVPSPSLDRSRAADPDAAGGLRPAR